MASVDVNVPYLTILLEKHPNHGATVHAGLARHGVGTPFCDELVRLFEFGVPAQDAQFARHLAAGWRHRYAEAFLELNRGCPICLDQLARIGAELGYAKPRSLTV